MSWEPMDLLSLQARGRKIHIQGGGDIIVGNTAIKADSRPNQDSIKCESIATAKNIVYSNRGMSLQNLVCQANEQYFKLHLAHIFDPGTPCKNVKDKEHGGRKLIYQEALVDHIGSWQGYSIAFDDKETHDPKGIFPAKNVKQHQIDFLLNFSEIGDGIAFLLVCYNPCENLLAPRFFIIPIKAYFPIWAARRGMPFSEAGAIGWEIWGSERACLDWLKGMEWMVAGEK